MIFCTCIVKCADSMRLINSYLTAVALCLPGVLTYELLEKKWYHSLLCVQYVCAMQFTQWRWHWSISMQDQVRVALCHDCVLSRLRFASVCTALMIMCGCGCAYSGCVGVNICSTEECVSGQQWEFLSSALVGHSAAACLSKLPHWRYSLSFSHLLNFPSFALARSHFHF